MAGSDVLSISESGSGSTGSENSSVWLKGILLPRDGESLVTVLRAAYLNLDTNQTEIRERIPWPPRN